MESFPTMASLAGMLDAQLPPDELPAAMAAPAATPVAGRHRTPHGRRPLRPPQDALAMRRHTYAR